MSEESALKKVCQKFLDPIVIKGDEVQGIIKDGQVYLKFLDSIVGVGYTYSIRASSQVTPENLDEMPEGKQVQLNIDPMSGLPYVCCKYVTMHCKYGVRYHRAMKLNDPEKKNRNYVSKKIGCESTLQVKIRHVLINKEYSNIHMKTAHRRRKMVEEIHQRLKSPNNKPFSTLWYYVSLKLGHTHPPQPVEVGLTENEEKLEEDNSNLVFHEVEVQTTSSVHELKATLRELLIDTIGMTYNLPDDDESVENIKELIFRASSIKSLVEAFLNPNEAKRPRFQSFAKRRRIQKAIGSLQKEALIKEGKWENFPQKKKRKIIKEKPANAHQTFKDAEIVGTQNTIENETSLTKEESVEDGLSIFEKEMLEASKRAEEAAEKDPLVQEDEFLEGDLCGEEKLFEPEGEEELFEPEGEEELFEPEGEEELFEPEGEEELFEQEGEEMFEEENFVSEGEEFSGEDKFMKEESQTKEEEGPVGEPQSRQIKVLKVTNVWGGYLNVELVSVNANELAGTKYSLS